MSNSDDKVPVFFPRFENEETAKTFKINAVNLAEVMTIAANTYLESLADKPELHPCAGSVGAACYLTSYLLSLNLDADKQAQVARGLVAMLLVNDDDMLKLASLPTDNLKAN